MSEGSRSAVAIPQAADASASNSSTFGVHLTPRAREWARFLVWLPLPIIVGCYWALRQAPALVSLEGEQLTIVTQLVFILPFVAAVAACLVAQRVALPFELRFWRWLGVACSCILVAEGYVSARLVLGGTPPVWTGVMPAVLHLAAAVAFLGLVTSMTRLREASVVARARYAVDAAVGLVLVFGVIAIMVVEPLYAPFEHVTQSERLMASAYPVVGVAMIIATLTNVLGLRASRWRSWERLVMASVAVYGTGVMAWPLWWYGMELAPASTLDISVESIWLVGKYLVLAAVVFRVTATKSVQDLRPLPPSVLSPASRGTAWAFTGVAMLTTAGLGVKAYLVPSDDRESWIAVFVIAALGLLAVRSTLAAIEHDHARRSAITDPVTGAHNRRFLHQQLEMELALTERYSGTVSLLVLDLDDFSRVNNVHGHSDGDAVLLDATAAVRAACRQGDVVCRYGGDELAVILPGTGINSARAIGERIRRELRGVQSDGTPLTASVGLACAPQHASSVEELIRLADDAQYWAKYHGKDRVVAYDPELVAETNTKERLRLLEEQSNLAMIRSLAATVDARDRLTRYHSRNVAELAWLVALELGFDEDEARLIEAAALLHDIGKIGVPDKILKKPNPLTAAEETVVREHVELGVRILRSTTLPEIVPWVRLHHECWDGSGYPDGLAGEEIPLEARVLALCDAFEAMTSVRPYRLRLSVAAALQDIDLSMGTQFDPAVAEAFIRVVGRRQAREAHSIPLGLRPEVAS